MCACVLWFEGEEARGKLNTFYLGYNQLLAMFTVSMGAKKNP